MPKKPAKEPLRQQLASLVQTPQWSSLADFLDRIDKDALDEIRATEPERVEQGLLTIKSTELFRKIIRTATQGELKKDPFE